MPTTTNYKVNGVDLGTLYVPRSYLTSNNEYLAHFLNRRQVWSWGNNTYKQISSEPSDVIGFAKPSTLFTMDCKEYCSDTCNNYFIDLANQLYVAGRNQHGQLGLGDFNARLSITKFPADNVGWKKIYSTLYTVIAIKMDGTLWGWGKGLSSSPQLLDSGIWISACITGTHILAIKQDGGLYTGLVGQTLTRLGTNTYKLVTGFLGSFAAIDIDGYLWTWGDNLYGQLATGNTNSVGSPIKVNTFKWKSVSLRGKTLNAIRTDGTLWSAGYNYLGFLATGDVSYAYSAVLLQDYTKSTLWKKVSSINGWCFYGLRTDGTLWVWGDFEFASSANGYSFFNPSSTNKDDFFDLYMVSLFTNASPITRGAIMSMFWPVLVESYGNNWIDISNGPTAIQQKTNPAVDSGFKIKPTQFQDLESFFPDTDPFSTYIDLSQLFIPKQSFVTGTLWMGGDNTYGQQGNVSATGVLEPNPTYISNWKSVSLGSNFSAGLLSDGSVMVWGSNADYQIGLPSVGNVYYPTRLNSPSYSGETNVDNWAFVACGSHNTILIDADGKVYAAGKDIKGEFGTTNINYINNEPTLLFGNAHVHTFAASHGDNIAVIRADDTLWISGSNEYGQMGLAHTNPMTGQQQFIAGQITKWKSVSLGDGFIAALDFDGDVWVCGNNQYGQLGNGTTSIVTTPVRYNYGTYKHKSVFSSSNSLYVITMAGGLFVSGHNNHGQLGNGTTQNSLTPTAIGGLEWKMVSASSTHAVGLKLNGSIFIWGLFNGESLTPTLYIPPVNKEWSTVIAGGENNYNVLALLAV